MALPPSICLIWASDHVTRKSCRKVAGRPQAGENEKQTSTQNKRETAAFGYVNVPILILQIKKMNIYEMMLMKRRSTCGLYIDTERWIRIGGERGWIMDGDCMLQSNEKLALFSIQLITRRQLDPPFLTLVCTKPLLLFLLLWYINTVFTINSFLLSYLPASSFQLY